MSHVCLFILGVHDFITRNMVISKDTLVILWCLNWWIFIKLLARKQDSTQQQLLIGSSKSSVLPKKTRPRWGASMALLSCLVFYSKDWNEAYLKTPESHHFHWSCSDHFELFYLSISWCIHVLQKSGFSNPQPEYRNWIFLFTSHPNPMTGPFQNTPVLFFFRQPN